jgi:predicted CopG family antitoxin
LRSDDGFDGDVAVFELRGFFILNANVDVPMATADEQIRVSDRVKRELDRLRREGERYNDVLERVLDEDGAGDFYDGFGRWSDEEAEGVCEGRRKSKEKQKQRMRGRAEDAV